MKSIVNSQRCGWARRMAAFTCTIPTIIYGLKKTKLDSSTVHPFYALCKYLTTFVNGPDQMIICFRYLDDKVFVSLANGDIAIYERDESCTYRF